MRINQSRVGSFLDCQELYKWTYEENLAPKHTSVPLVTGSALHAGLAILRTSEDLGKAQAGVEEYYREVLKKEAERQSFLPEELEAAEQQILWGKIMLARFVKQYPEPEWQVLEPEVAGEVKIGASDHTLVFRVDGLMQWRGQFWLAEYKTKGRVTQPYLKSFNMDKQVSCYVYGGQKMLGKPIAGSLVFIFPKTPADARILLETPLRTPDQIKRIEGELIDVCDMIEARRETGVWLRNERICFAPGRYECIFYKLCMFGASADALATYAKREKDYVDEE